MRSFEDIYAIAAERHGGTEPIEARLAATAPKSPDALAAIGDDRWLAGFARAIFQAGFNWKVVERMWPGFEEAFHRFDPARVAMMDDGWFDVLVTDTRIVRHGPKIRAVRDNAVMLTELAGDHGSAGRFFADWPAADFAALLAYLKTHGARLGGTTGQYALRSQGVDGYILSRDVVGRLIAEGVIDKPPGSKSSMAAVQAAFNIWRSQSGRSLTDISRVLALSIG